MRGWGEVEHEWITQKHKTIAGSSIQRLYLLCSSSSLPLDLGMGIVFTRCKKQLQQNGTSGSAGSGDSSGMEEMENGMGGGTTEHVVRAIYTFSGNNEDEVSV